MTSLIDERLNLRSGHCSWTKGSPYVGLEAFDLDHAAVFYGRDQEALDLANRLQERSNDLADGCAAAFIIGSSGSGKSSLARAGLASLLTSQGAELVPDTAQFTPLALCPSELGTGKDTDTAHFAELIDRLATIYPTLTEATDSATLTRALESDPLTFVELSLRPAITRARTEKGHHRALLIIDQFEEIFTLPGWKDDPTRQAKFVKILHTLASSPGIWVVCTLRSDFYAAAQSVSGLLDLRGERPFDLLPPSRSALWNIITRPALAAGLSFETDASGRHLADRILDAVDDQPDALPLLQFLLSELHARREFDDGNPQAAARLTHAAYDALGGIEGAVQTRAEETLMACSDGEPPSLPLQVLLSQLFTISTTTGEEKPVRRPALEAELLGADASFARRFLDAFTGARLLTTAETPGGERTYRVAHETLLTGWTRMVELRKSQIENFRRRTRIEDAQKQYDANGAEPSLLLPDGLPLAEATAALSEAPFLLTPAQTSYIETSQAHHRSRRRRKRLTVGAVILALTLLTTGAIWGFLHASEQEKIAERAREAAQTSADQERQAKEQSLKLLKSVRANLNFMNFDLRDVLKKYAPVAERVKVTDQVADLLKALETLPETDSDEQTSTGDLRQRAVGLMNRADLLLQSAPHDPAEAEALYKEALEMTHRIVTLDPNNTEFQRDLSVSYDSLGDFYLRLGETQKALEFYQQSLEARQRLVSLDPEDTQFQSDLSVSYEKLGNTQLLLGETQKALEFYEQAQEVRQKLVSLDPDNTQFQRDLSVSYDRLGDIQLRLGETQKALEFYEQALEVRQELVTLDPDNTQFQRGLSVSYGKLGDIQLRLGETPKALEFYEQALEVRQELVTLDPDNTQFQRGLSVSFDNLGDIQLRLGETQKALEFYEQALEVRQELVSLDPDNTQFQRDLSVSYNNLGDIQLRLGETPKALEFYEQALEVSQKLVTLDPNNTEFQRDLSVSYNNLGDIQLRLGETQKALEFYEQFLEVARKLVTLNPDNMQFQRGLSVSFEKLGDIQLRLGETPKALEFYEQALEVRQELVTLDPDNTQFQRDLVVSHYKLSTVYRHAAVDNIPKAIAELERALKILRDMKAAGTLAPDDEEFIPMLEDELGELR